MLWRFFQSAIITIVAGWLLASGATRNGLAAGVVGYIAAAGITVAVGWVADLRHWLGRRSGAPAPQRIAPQIG